MNDAYADVLAQVNAELTYYDIEAVEDGKIIGEDGQYTRTNGYAVRNTLTNVIEHTSLLFPGAIFQAQHLDNTLKSLLAGRDPVQETLGLAAMSTEDVTPN